MNGLKILLVAIARLAWTRELLRAFAQSSD